MASTRTSGKRAALALFLLTAGVSTAAATEGAWRLLMFDAQDCAYCELWEHEVGDVYPKTDEGRRAPLSKQALADGVPSGISLRQPVHYTPTFVVVSRNGEEVDRIVGYPGEMHFWGLLGAILDKAERQ